MTKLSRSAKEKDVEAGRTAPASTTQTDDPNIATHPPNCRELLAIRNRSFKIRSYRTGVLAILKPTVFSFLYTAMLFRAADQQFSALES